jgi:hypothetical protein
VHRPPFGPEKPKLQLQAVSKELPGGESEFCGQARHVDSLVAEWESEYFPAPQSMQEAEPTISLYFPVAHCEQLPPSDPLDPALQRQLFIEMLPAGAFEPVGQAKHVLEAACPVAEEYLPAPQSVHAASPVPDLYLPATQPSHARPF